MLGYSFCCLKDFIYNSFFLNIGNAVFGFNVDNLGKLKKSF